jgi:nucleotide-binding universal stress UspA family protein
MSSFFSNESRLVSGEIAGQLAAAAAAFDMAIAGARGAGHVMHFLLGRTSTRLVRIVEKLVVGSVALRVL